MIDFHAHMGFLNREGRADRPNLNADGLVALMDARGLDQAVLLPLESPDWGGGYLLNEECLAARDKYPDRFIVFACADPRYPLASKMIDHMVRNCGCVGFGEHVNGLPLDDPLNKQLYAQVNELGLPMVFEIARPRICFDEPHLPRLEKLLAEFPRIKWVGHGPHFWSAISGEDGTQQRHDHARRRHRPADGPVRQPLRRPVGHVGLQRHDARPGLHARLHRAAVAAAALRHRRLLRQREAADHRVDAPDADGRNRPLRHRRRQRPQASGSRLSRGRPKRSARPVNRCGRTEGVLRGFPGTPLSCGEGG